MSTIDNKKAASVSSTLAAHHRELLADSAISEEVAAERGYYTATKRAQLADLGFPRAQQVVPSLIIPIRDSRGGVVTYQARPDQPRIGANGRPIKYETPAATPPALDVPIRARASLRSSHSPLWITEGARKADAAVSAGLTCVSLPGVWSWVKRLNGDARTVLPDLQRVKLEERKVVVAFDSDVMTKPAVHQALEALAAYLNSQGALVHCLYLPEPEPGEKCGLDDFLAANKVEDLWQHVESTLRQPPKPKPKTPALPTANLLATVESLLCRYVRFPDEHGPTALALFALHTHAFSSAAATPYIYIKSPQKRSGKTRVLEVLELPVRGALRSSSISAAAIYQSVEKWRPTLLIDEVDAVFSSKSEKAEALREIINGGNRPGAPAVRGSQDGEPAVFDCFSPKVLAGIDSGRLPDTIRDRSIVIGLERKLRTDRVDRLRNRKIAGEVEELRGRLSDWATENEEALADFEAESMFEIDDRLDEAWEPLFAIAELAGCGWPERARAAAIALSAGAEDSGEDHAATLLSALRAIVVGESMLTKDICKLLNEDDDLPFGAYRKDEGIDGRRLSRMLKPYAIRPTNVRPPEGGQGKGYRREDFEAVWARYTADPETSPAQEAASGPSQASQRPSPADYGSSKPQTNGTDIGTDAIANSSRDVPTSAGTDNGTDGVTDPSHPQTASESQIQPPWDAGTDGTDQRRPAAGGTFSNGNRPAETIDPVLGCDPFPGMRRAPGYQDRPSADPPPKETP